MILLSLATADCLHELLESARLRLNRSDVRWRLLALGRLGRPLLGEVLGAVLELGLRRASRSNHVSADTPHPAPPLRCHAGGVCAISLLAHLFDR